MAKITLNNSTTLATIRAALNSMFTELYSAVAGKADALTTDQNYVSDAELAVLQATSGENTGDQDLSGKQDVLSEGAFEDGDKTKLNGIEAGATADQDLSGLEPKQTAATQAEMEAGVESGIRSMSPLGIAQAIAVLGGEGGGLSDAPSDGSTYGRKDGAWAVVGTGTGEANEVMDSTPTEGNTDHTVSSDGLFDAFALKQDILSEGAFEDGDKTKLDGIASGATNTPIVQTVDPTGTGEATVAPSEAAVGDALAGKMAASVLDDTTNSTDEDADAKIWSVAKNAEVYQPELGNVGTAGNYFVGETVLGLRSLAAPGTWKLFYSDGAGGGIKEIDITEAGKVLTSNATGGPPSMEYPGKIATKTATAAYTAGTTDPREAYGGVVYTSNTGTISLPAIASGMSVSIIATAAVAVTIDPNGTEKILLDGVDATAGVTIVSPGAIGDVAVLTYYGAGVWYASTNSWTVGS